MRINNEHKEIIASRVTEYFFPKDKLEQRFQEYELELVKAYTDTIPSVIKEKAKKYPGMFIYRHSIVICSDKVLGKNLTNLLRYGWVNSEDMIRVCFDNHSVMCKSSNSSLAFIIDETLYKKYKELEQITLSKKAFEDKLLSVLKSVNTDKIAKDLVKEVAPQVYIDDIFAVRSLTVYRELERIKQELLMLLKGGKE